MAQQNHGPPSPGLQKLRVDRLRKEEEEEQWISGEELYTEGSSDDEDHHRSSSRGRVGEQRRQRHGGGGGGGKKNNPAVTTRKQQQQQRRRPEALLPAAAAEVRLELDDSEDEDEEVEEEISWRPKRGSVKLPELSPGEGGWLECSSVAGGGEVRPRGAMDKIREMDALLFVVEAKRKESEAKTEQSQLRIRQVLKELCEGASASRQSKVLATKFIRLCDKATAAAADADVATTRQEAVRDKTSRGPSFTVKMKGTRRRRRSHHQASSRASNTTTRRNKKKKDCARLKFLLRNVQLAADGKGTLAVTAEEKVRLASLLRGRRPSPHDKFLVLEPGAVQLLSQIDSKLKEFSAETSTTGREDETLENYALRLEEIEAALSRLNQATTQVVSPLEEGELRGLLEACRPRQESSSCPTPTPSACSSGDSLQPHPATPPPPAEAPTPAPAEDHLLLDGFGELVAEARRLMPFFKFKY